MESYFKFSEVRKTTGISISEKETDFQECELIESMHIFLTRQMLGFPISFTTICNSLGLTRESTKYELPSMHKLLDSRAH